MAALRAAFDDPDAYQTAYTKISSLRQERDCSSYHTAFIRLATILGIDERTKISFFKKGLNGELKKALSYQITLPDIFDEFVQACIKIDNQIRANKEAHDSQGHKVDSSRLPLPPMPALAPAHTLAPWTYLRLGTALRSEALLPTKKRSATRTITCAYNVVPPAIGPRNAPINDQGQSPLLPLPPSLKEVCPFLLPRLFCLLLPLPLPKSSMRQKTNFRCK